MSATSRPATRQRGTVLNDVLAHLLSDGTGDGRNARDALRKRIVSMSKAPHDIAHRRSPRVSDRMCGIRILQGQRLLGAQVAHVLRPEAIAGALLLGAI
jgi:hypothetical protein